MLRFVKTNRLNSLPHDCNHFLSWLVPSNNHFVSISLPLKIYEVNNEMKNKLKPVKNDVWSNFLFQLIQVHKNHKNSQKSFHSFEETLNFTTTKTKASMKSVKCFLHFITFELIFRSLWWSCRSRSPALRSHPKHYLLRYSLNFRVNMRFHFLLPSLRVARNSSTSEEADFICFKIFYCVFMRANPAERRFTPCFPLPPFCRVSQRCLHRSSLGLSVCICRLRSTGIQL